MDRSDLPRILEDLAEARLSLSLHELGREIGITPNAVKKLLNGAVPHPTTVTRLRNWHSAYVAGSPKQQAMQSLEFLVASIPNPRVRHRTMEAILASLAAAYSSSQVRAPGWIDELREEVHAAS